MSELERIVQSWTARAEPYLALTKKYALFERLADRLVSATPTDFAGTVVDIGAGAGLVTKRLLAARPSARAFVAEPSVKMIRLAEAELAPFGPRVRFVGAAADELPGELVADAALSSAAMHLVEEDRAFPSIARALRQGGVFVYNLWGHSYDETAELDPDRSEETQRLYDRALEEHGLPPKEWPPLSAPPRKRTRAALEALAQASGMTLDRVDIDIDEAELAYAVEFTAMSPKFLGNLPLEQRRSVVLRATELGAARVEIRSVRFSLRKTHVVP